jgi:hypothetical protein
MMVRVAFQVARQAVGREKCADARRWQRQADRRGTLAVKNGPPTRGSGGVADSLRVPSGFEVLAAAVGVGIRDPVKMVAEGKPCSRCGARPRAQGERGWRATTRY